MTQETPTAADAPRAGSAERVLALEAAVGETILGQGPAIREAVACLLSGGHGLLEGAVHARQDLGAGQRACDLDEIRDGIGASRRAAA